MQHPQISDINLIILVLCCCCYLLVAVTVLLGAARREGVEQWTHIYVPLACGQPLVYLCAAQQTGDLFTPAPGKLADIHTRTRKTGLTPENLF